MKEAELAQHSTCDLCNRIVTASGLPLFWRVRVERFGLNARNIKRQMGLGEYLGSPALASIMGTDPDMAEPVMEPVMLTVCEGCAMDKMGHLAHVALEKSAAADREPT